MSRPKVVGLIWIVSALALTFIIAGGFNLFIDLVPFKTEKWVASKVDLPACKMSSDASAALEKIRQRLYPVLPGDRAFDLHLHVIEEKEVNAFAFLGGNIYIHTGLLDDARNGDEVAGVLAHEIAHVAHRDVIHGIAGQLVTAVMMSVVGDSTVLTRIFAQVAGLRFTRKQEEAADTSAFERLRLSHVSTKPMAEFFKRLDDGGPASSMLSDHPEPGARAYNASKIVVENPTPVLTAPEWLALKSACH